MVIDGEEDDASVFFPRDFRGEPTEAPGQCEPVPEHTGEGPRHVAPASASAVDAELGLPDGFGNESLLTRSSTDEQLVEPPLDRGEHDSMTGTDNLHTAEPGGSGTGMADESDGEQASVTSPVIARGGLRRGTRTRKPKQCPCCK